MTPSLAALLAQDGIVTGAIYALLSTALVLVFSVTRVPFVPLGGFVSYAALTLASMQDGHPPRTAWVVVALGVLCWILDTGAARRRPGLLRASLRSACAWIVLPAAACLPAWLASSPATPVPLGMAAALLLVAPLGPMIYRVAFQPLPDGDPLTFFMLSIAIDAAMIGLGLVLFGPDGVRTASYTALQFSLNGVPVPGQNVYILAVAALLTLGLYLFFHRTVRGKMLRATAVNRVGARLMGISVEGAGRLAMTLAAIIGALCGLLIAPNITLTYASGLMIGLKGFIAAVIGGFVSYPIAAAGAVLIGLLESFSSFWASAWKETIVFTLIVPVLLLRTLYGRLDEE